MIVCTKCNQFFHPKKNGVLVEEGMPRDTDQKRGEGHWLPYKLWQADLLECKGCGTEIIAGFGYVPLSEHYMPDYNRVKERLGPVRSFVKDCI